MVRSHRVIAGSEQRVPAGGQQSTWFCELSQADSGTPEQRQGCQLRHCWGGTREPWRVAEQGRGVRSVRPL